MTKITYLGQKPLFCRKYGVVYAIDLMEWGEFPADELDKEYQDCDVLVHTSQKFWLYNYNEAGLEHWTEGMTEVTMEDAHALVKSGYRAARVLQKKRK